jgi:hypothetical protein
MRTLKVEVLIPDSMQQGSSARGRIWLFGAASLFAGMLLVQAQPYGLDWQSTDGGGGTSSGGVFTVAGTIGQPDTGAMSGGQITLQGGFWPGMIVPSAGETPTLFISRSGDSVVISWSPATAGFQLEATTDVAGGVWTAAPAGNPVTLPITGSAGFYRLKKP